MRCVLIRPLSKSTYYDPEIQEPLGPICHLTALDEIIPYCAACQLKTLKETGVQNFKIAGRGYPRELIVKAVRFLRKTADDPEFVPPAIRSSYHDTFGQYCNEKFCYYR
jgi:hypothetical protein